VNHNAAQSRPTVGALSGIVVADFSRVLAAPYATMLFGDLGADVIKIERPGLGDDTRHWGPPFTDNKEATYFLSVNRNKRSLVADMSDPGVRDELIELIRRADVLIENFRPGTMAKYGLSYEQVQQINPRLVYCSITGFGAGKGAALPGYDLLVQAVGGLMSVTGPRRGEPVKAGVAVGKPVGVCGEAAADPLLACVLVGLGVSSLSAAAAAVSGVGAKLAHVSLAQCREAAVAAVATATAADARAAAIAVLG